MHYVDILKQALVASADVRVLHNVGWSFPKERVMFESHPYFFTCDTQHGTNVNKMHAAIACGVDGDSRNIVLAQGFLKDLKTVTFMWWFCTCLPYLAGPRSLLRINSVCMDGSPEQKAGFVAAKRRAVFHPRVGFHLCYFHKVVQEIRDPKHLGIVAVHPTVYACIVDCLDHRGCTSPNRDASRLTEPGCIPAQPGWFLAPK